MEHARGFKEFLGVNAALREAALSYKAWRKSWSVKLEILSHCCAAVSERDSKNGLLTFQLSEPLKRE